ncbi:MAG: succinate--CoA ligase subunit alpha [Candidatus Eisenbacteria bacterium]|nr:succinate--CoA ligase subunit alpha [Candidatus Eisenbacteria bacterium]
MSILIDRHTRLIVQGITGRDGGFHTQQMIAYGTRVVAGVTPGRGGEKVHGVPVFDSVAEAIAETKANTSVIYVPAPFATDAVYEAADAGVGLIVCITEGIPVRDAMGAWHHVAALRDAAAVRAGAPANARRNWDSGAGRPRLIGPNCPGLISPGQSKVGILPGQICAPGPVGLESRSGTLTYEVVAQLTHAGLGQSTCIGIGGDPIIGTSFVDTLELFEADPATEAIVLIGEIGGSDEEEAAQFIRRRVRKPVVAFIAGQTAPPGKRMGHAGAIISGGSGTAAEKMAAFAAVGVPVARIPSEIPGLIAEALERRRPRGRRSEAPARRENGRNAAKARRPAKAARPARAGAGRNGNKGSRKPAGRSGTRAARAR